MMDRAALCNRLEEGWRPDLLFFWGHRPQADGSVGPGCLSQFWPSAFEVDGQLYATAEHWMMASKARLFSDDDALARVLTSPEPAQAKAVGRTVRGFDEATWRAHRLDIVVQGNVAKFSQNDDERSYLLGTAPAVLVEASPRDRIWGIGMGAANPAAVDPTRWRGQNLLGFALMEVRRRIGG